MRVFVYVHFGVLCFVILFLICIVHRFPTYKEHSILARARRCVVCCPFLCSVFCVLGSVLVLYVFSLLIVVIVVICTQIAIGL